MKVKLSNFPILLIAVFSLLIGLNTFTSCKKDGTRTIEIRYDAANFDAPLLPANNYEGAVRFPAAVLDQYPGAELTKVEFYIKNVPNSTEIKIYRGSLSGTSPSEEVYSAVLTGNVAGSSWNEHVLSTPVAVNGDDLWISIAFGHTTDLQALGCDPGPAVSNGDLIFDPAQGLWRALSSFTPVNINWNIRGELTLPTE